MTDIDDIHERHYLDDRFSGHYCAACMNDWPCDTQVMRMEAFAADADAEQLAEALYGLLAEAEGLQASSSWAQQDAARDALKAHEDRRR